MTNTATFTRARPGATRCFAFPRRTVKTCRVCKKRKRSGDLWWSHQVNFGDSRYSFWTIEHRGERVICRTRRGQTAANRIKLAKKEAPAEIRKMRQRVKDNPKYGVAWAFQELSKIGRLEHQYHFVLELLKAGTVREATQCEIALWMDGHKKDRENCEENLNYRWLTAMGDFKWGRQV